MNNQSHSKPGYILFLTISVLAIMTVVVTQIYYVGSAYNTYVPLVFEREKAKQLALSGISIAMAQLLLQDKQLQSTKRDVKASESKKDAQPAPDAKKDEAGGDPSKNQKELLKTLLLVQNQWQTFDLTTAKDGIDAQIKICITCDNGKFNMNKVYNGKKVSAEMVGEKERLELKLLKMITERMKSFFKDIDVTTLVIDALQRQNYQNVMELLKNKKFNFMAQSVYFVPSDRSLGNSDGSRIYLYDVFTTATFDLQIDPWVMSSSLQTVFGLKQIKQLKKEDIETILEKISLTQIDWEKQWDSTLKEIYGKEYKALPENLRPFLSTKFEPRVFSVVCYAKVGRIEQKLLAVLRRSAAQKGDKVTVKKIYWL